MMMDVPRILSRGKRRRHKIIPMPIYLALLLSLALHAGLIAGPIWLTPSQRRPATAAIDARLIPYATPERAAETISSEVPGEPESSPRPVTPGTLQGPSLRRAQAALSNHLYYPPEAVAHGLEGDVVLLLVLTDSGRLVSAAVARSSGHPLLDQAALDAAFQLGALPGNPSQILFPVSFRLQ